MNTVKLKARSGEDGILKLEVPAAPNQAFEVVLVLHAVETEAVDELGWPIGFFEETYGSLADDPIELGPDLPLPVRDEME
jgi:hypothetical protein